MEILGRTRQAIWKPQGRGSQECKASRGAASAFLSRNGREAKGLAWKGEKGELGCGGGGGRRPGQDHAWMAFWATEKTLDFFFLCDRKILEGYEWVVTKFGPCPSRH